METVYATNDFSLVLRGRPDQKIEFSAQSLQVSTQTEEGTTYTTVSGLAEGLFSFRLDGKGVSVCLLAAHTCYDCATRRTTYYMAGDRIAVFWPSMDETGAQKFVPCACKYNDDFPALVVDAEAENAARINTLFLKRGFQPWIRVGDKKFAHFTSSDENQQVYRIGDLSYFWIEAELDADAHPGLQNPIHAISGVRCARQIRLGHRGLGSNKDYAEVTRDYLKLGYAVKQPIAENTLTAYRTACEKYGIDGVELDVILTKDRQCVVNHNFWIDCGGVHMPINAISLAQFKQAPLARVFPRRAKLERSADDFDALEAREAERHAKRSRNCEDDGA